MPSIDINDVSSLGVIQDTKPWQVPPEAWTVGNNVRFRDGAAEKMEGWSEVFAGAPVAPHFAMPVTTSSQTFWPYVSLNKAYVWDGTTHTEITRLVGGDYTATDTSEWNGTLLGGVAIFNNLNDIPQFWASPAIATDLANLTNWPTNLRAKFLRAFGPYLIAGNLLEGTTAYPHAVQWSHPADPGSVPSSWDITDPTKDAGRNDFPDVQSGSLLDGQQLRGAMYLYKESSTWRMRFIGGRFVFAFDSFLDTAGILATRCVTATGDGQSHFMVTQDDIMTHNGNTAESIGEKRFKRYLFNQIDVTNFRRSFCFTNPQRSECWFCYPSLGSNQPDRALIWNYGENVFSESDVDFRNAAIGTVETTGGDTWATVSGTWDTILGPWQLSNRRKVVLCNPALSKFFQLDSGTLRNTSTFTATLQRTALSIVGRSRTGRWIEDIQAVKFVDRLWPKVRGGPILIRVGFQQSHEGTVAWSSTKVFDPATQVYIDFEGSGRAVAVEFSTTADVAWQLDGYKIEMEVVGEY